MVNVAAFGSGTVGKRGYLSEAPKAHLQGLCCILTPAIGTFSGHYRAKYVWIVSTHATVEA